VIVKAAEAEENFDLGDGESAETEAAPEKEPTLEDVIEGFKAYAGKHGREKAGAILKKFGVKSVRDLKSEKYGEVLALIGV